LPYSFGILYHCKCFNRAEDKIDGECSPLLQMLGKDGMLPIIENAMGDGNTMDGKCSPFPLLISVPKATQHIRSPLHRLSPCQLKKLFYKWEVLPIWHIL
jgi:hypothetical protein